MSIRPSEHVSKFERDFDSDWLRPAVHAERAAKKIDTDLVKFDPDQPRDEFGKWTDAGGAATGPGPDPDARAGLKAAVDAFAKMPTVRNSGTAAAKKWLTDHRELYDNNREFRGLVRTISDFTQGNYSEVRGGAQFALTGVMPSNEYTGLNKQAWESAMTGERWHNMMYNHQTGQDEPQRDMNGNVLWLEPNVMHMSPTLAEREAGNTPAERLETLTYKEGGQLLNEAIAAAPEIDTVLYRGVRPTEGDRYWMSEDGKTIIQGSRYHERGEEPPHYYEGPREPSKFMSVGDTIDLLGPASFTTNYDIAERITEGRQQMGDFKPQAGRAGLIVQTEGPVQALNAQAISPFSQAEYITSGRFTVTDIKMLGHVEVRSGYGGKYYMPQFVVTVKQEGTWQPD